MNPAKELAPERILRVHIAALKLNCSARTIIRKIEHGEIAATRIGRRAWGIRACDLVAGKLGRGGYLDRN
jgi:excisionase family DNA binding protein